MMYLFSKYFFGTILRVFFGFRSYGKQNVPAKGGVIVCSNHQSFVDPLMVGCGMDRVPVRFMARASLWDVKWMGWWYYQVGAFPVKRGGADRNAWRHFEEMVTEGQIICFFPEGTRSPDGKLQPANPGSGLLLHRCKDAVIIPARIFDTCKVLPKGKIFGGFHRVSIVFGPPVDLSAEMAMDGNREVYEAMSKKVMDAISALQAPVGRHPA